MTPLHLERLAERLRPWRWWLVAVSLAGLAAVPAGILWLDVKLVAAVPLALVAWGFVCISVWFDPTHGVMQPDRLPLCWLPPAVTTVLRWWAAITVTVLIAVAVLVQVGVLRDLF